MHGNWFCKDCNVGFRHKNQLKAHETAGHDVTEIEWLLPGNDKYLEGIYG